MSCGDLGHVNNLLDKCLRVEEPHDIRQLYHHLRHRNVHNLDHGHDVGKLLHAAQMDPFLWLLRLTLAGWPGSPGLFLIRLEEVRLVRRLFRILAVTCNSNLLPAPGLLLSPWGCVVVPLGKEHRNRRCPLLVTAPSVCATLGMSSLEGSDRPT